MNGNVPVCCVCGRELPNRWAVGGRCSEKGCAALFCRMHAAVGNGRCPEHGWKEAGMGGRSAGDGESPKGLKCESSKLLDCGNSEGAGSEGRRAEERRLALKASADLAKKAMTETVALAGKVGTGARWLWTKIHVDRSPEAMLASLHGSLDENAARREKVAAELEALHIRIAAKKKAYESVPPVRQRMLKTELQTLMANYKSLEREFNLLAENEQTILTVKGRFMELIAHGLRGRMDEGMIDRLADSIEEKSEDAESLQDAMADLEKAGRRRERDGGDFDAELAGFGEAEEAVGSRQPAVGGSEAEDEGRESQVAGRESEKKDARKEAEEGLASGD